ncbi:MAG TPA: PepSY domain-containing protein, partial [Chitinophagaceae bacterium]|nr:PepSY domain-containing protein [Chitinophagaceae bacterium]
DTIIVPTTIRTSFMTRYPNATNVVWYRYHPGPLTPAPTDWYYILDTSDYYSTFIWNGDEYVAWYDNGTWIRSSRSIAHSELPAAVSRAITAQFPGFVITDVDLENDKSQTVYEVDLEKGNKKWEVHFNEGGAILKKKPRDLSPLDPQADMVTDFETRYPNATQVTWYRYVPRDRVEVLPTDWDYEMDADDYEVRFSDGGTEYVAFYDEGKWVRSEAYTFDATKLPAAVNDVLKRDYAGYTIKEVDQEIGTAGTLYEVELLKGTDKCKIHFMADGNVQKKKCKDSMQKIKEKN